jgi:hypothetical protein
LLIGIYALRFNPRAPRIKARLPVYLRFIGAPSARPLGALFD